MAQVQLNDVTRIFLSLETARDNANVTIKENGLTQENRTIMKEAINVIWMHLNYLLAGSAGAACTLTGCRNIYVAVWAIIKGGLIAHYLTPLFMYFLRLSHDLELATAFFIGIMGMRGVKLVEEQVRKQFANGHKKAPDL